jgi:hypothetical protein
MWNMHEQDSKTLAIVIRQVAMQWAEHGHGVVFAQGLRNESGELYHPLAWENLPESVKIERAEYLVPRVLSHLASPCSAVGGEPHTCPSLYSL